MLLTVWWRWGIVSMVTKLIRRLSRPGSDSEPGPDPSESSSWSGWFWSVLTDGPKPDGRYLIWFCWFWFFERTKGEFHTQNCWSNYGSIFSEFFPSCQASSWRPLTSGGKNRQFYWDFIFKIKLVELDFCCRFWFLVRSAGSFAVPGPVSCSVLVTQALFYFQ